jgi:hypothetical protein
LGNLTGGTQKELAEMRDLLEGRDPFEVTDQVTDPLILDVLDILKADGFQARIQFFETN